MGCVLAAILGAMAMNLLITWAVGRNWLGLGVCRHCGKRL